MGTAGGEEDTNQAAAPTAEVVSMAVDDHDVTAALFNSLGAAEITPQDQASEEEDTPSTFPGHENDAMETMAGGEPINWGEMGSTEPGVSIHEDELEGMFMALDEEGRDADDADYTQPESLTTGHATLPESIEVDDTQSMPTTNVLSTAKTTAHNNEVVGSNEMQLAAAVENYKVETNPSVQNTAEAQATDQEEGAKETTVGAEIKEDRAPVIEEEQDVTAALLDSLTGENTKLSDTDEVQPVQPGGLGEANSALAEDTQPLKIDNKEENAAPIEGDQVVKEAPAHDEGGEPTKTEQDARACVVCSKATSNYKCPLCSAPL